MNDELYYAKVVAAYVLYKLGAPTISWEDLNKEIERLMPRVKTKNGTDIYDFIGYLKLVNVWLTHENIPDELRQKLIQAIQEKPHVISIYVLARWEPSYIIKVLTEAGFLPK